MFNCATHNWSHFEKPCPICTPVHTYTGSSTLSDQELELGYYEIGNKSLKTQIQKLEAQIAELKKANANCISLLLHESRMRAAEKQIAEYEAALDDSCKCELHPRDVPPNVHWVRVGEECSACQVLAKYKGEKK